MFMHFSGSPAHAGIDPCAPVLLLKEDWLPRSRGDRPWAGVLKSISLSAPPLTRG